MLTTAYLVYETLKSGLLPGIGEDVLEVAQCVAVIKKTMRMGSHALHVFFGLGEESRVIPGSQLKPLRLALLFSQTSFFFHLSVQAYQAPLQALLFTFFRVPDLAVLTL